jgi:cell division protein FtsZ
VLARAAKEAGALALAFVTLPFPLESNHRRELAQDGLEELKSVAAGVICLPNKKVAKLIDEHMSLLDGYGISRQLLIEGVRGIWRLLTHRGLIEIHFEELSALLRERQGESCFAAVEAAGTTRSRDALEKLLGHPLLDGGAALKEADAVMVSLMGGPDLSMADVNRVMETLNQQCERARIIMGAAVDEAFRDRLCVTVVATRRGAEKTEGAKVAESSHAKTDEPDFDSELLHKTETKRTASRIVPPAPDLTTEQREQIISKHGKSARSRKGGPRMRQTTLQLDIVSKGRFDKTEPTVHKGEDLDLPTYIRRGVALN